MTTRKTVVRMAAFVLGLAALGCDFLALDGDDVDVDVPGKYDDISGDPDIDPPAPIPEEEQNLSVSFSYQVEEGAANADGDRIQVVLNALLDPVTHEPITGLDAYDEVMVIEDDTVKGLKVEAPEEVSGDVNLGADVVFIIDTTGSMSGAIEGVKSSVNQFANYLGSQGFDVRLGAVPYGDYAPLTENPYYDATTYPGAAYFDLTSDFGSDTTSFNTFINGLTSSYLGDGGNDGPENPLDAIVYADENFAWRAGAIKVFVLLTDVNAHIEGDPTDATSNLTDESISGVIERMAGNAVIHVVSANYYSSCYVSTAAEFPAFFECIETNPTYTPEAGYGDCKELADGTGGLWYPMPTDGQIDLTTIPLTDTISAVHVLTFVSDNPGSTHDLRVWVNTTGSGGALKGEFTFEGVVY